MGQDLMELLGEGNPVDLDEVRGWAEGEEGRRVFFDVVAVGGRRIRRPLTRRARPALLPVAAAGLALALMVGSVVLPDGRGGASASAAEVLLAAAKTARAQSADPSVGEYRYTRSKLATLATEGEGAGSYTVAWPLVREMWVAPDGSGRIRERNDEPVFLRPEDRAAWKASGSPQLWHTGVAMDDAFGPGQLPYEDDSGFSTDPDELFEQIERRAVESSSAPVPEGAPVTQEMFVIVADLLRETVTPPELRAALYEVAARIPDVELVGDVTDPVGRPGVAVAMTWEQDAIREELIFDPVTSELLAVRQVIVRPVKWIDADPGTAVHWATYLESGTTDSTRDRPSR
ncbi:MAG: CU044_5270 family protein [Actinomycetota bacterium]|nr:CU044_5270 family protein [Actinomycetota bacterium]